MGNAIAQCGCVEVSPPAPLHAAILSGSVQEVAKVLLREKDAQAVLRRRDR